MCLFRNIQKLQTPRSTLIKKIFKNINFAFNINFNVTVIQGTNRSNSYLKGAIFLLLLKNTTKIYKKCEPQFALSYLRVTVLETDTVDRHSINDKGYCKSQL